jgi:hypothetical protein
MPSPKGCDVLSDTSDHSRLCSCSADAIPTTRDPAAPYDCAKANDQAQRAAFPDWWYTISHDGMSDAPLGAPEPLHVGFEPLLEAVPGCNGLTGELAGGLKEFRFLVVLDGSWVSYFNSRKAAFVAQGYPTLESSANLLLDRASFIFEAQFGSRVRASRVFAFPDLGEACATNNNHVDDGSDATSTAKALSSVNVVASSAEAGTLRLGAGSLTAGQYCHSTAPIGGLCSPSSTLTNQKTPFQASTDHIDHGTVATLVHELGHFFGVCGDANSPDCLNRHMANEIADIMVDDGRPAINVRAEGVFLKFMPTCTDIYDDLVCSRVQAASPSCGHVIAPAKGPTTGRDEPECYDVTTTTDDNGVRSSSDQGCAGYELPENGYTCVGNSCAHADPALPGCAIKAPAGYFLNPATGKCSEPMTPTATPATVTSTTGTAPTVPIADPKPGGCGCSRRGIRRVE